MGEVYLAEQREPIHRRVALKVIKLGMDTRAVVARFESERQALALMDHPNVAKVFEAGTTAEGRPYFVMEHVQGEPITTYCDRHRLTTRQRLQLFRKVCHAVQHSHQKAIIHRDIKPSNILVTIQDGKPIPKVIDFGVAKAIEQRLTEKTLFTEHGQLIGTPAYMSPEQAEMTALNIDTRTDIYSLGVVLYELLVGAPPFDNAYLRSAGFGEIQRIIREQDPPRPSTRLSNLGERDSHSAASMRRTSCATLERQLRGDLDWITLKAMDKDRTRRYATAAELADDLARHLSDRPVLASPPGAGYRLNKFIRRNKTSVAAAVVIVVVLFAATATSISFALREANQRHVAQDNLALAENREQEAIAARNAEADAKADAQKRADELEQVAKFQEAQLGNVDADGMGTTLRNGLRDKIRAVSARRKLDNNAITELEGKYDELVAGADFTGLALQTLDQNVFDPALVAIERQFANQPLIQARLLQTLASTMRNAGLLEQATKPQTEALRIRRNVLGDDHPDTLKSVKHIGRLLQGQGKLNEAQAYLGEAIAGFRRVLGDEDQHTLNAISHMGEVFRAMGKMDEAQAYTREALEGCRRVLRGDHVAILTLLNNMGNLLSDEGKYAEAERYYREALAGCRRQFGNEHSNTLSAMSSLGALLQEMGKLEEAHTYNRDALAGHRRVLGDEHPGTLLSINNMGWLLRAQGKVAESEPFFREALAGYRRVLGADHPHALISMSNLGGVLKSQRKYAEAEPYYRQALEGSRRALGDSHPNTLGLTNNLASFLESQGKYAEAEDYYRKVVEGCRRVLGENHPHTLLSMNNLSGVLYNLGKYTEAEHHYREVVEDCVRVLGNDHLHTLTSMTGLAGVLRHQGKHAEAEHYYRESLARCRRVLGDDHLNTKNTINGLAKALNAQKRYAESEQLLRAIIHSGSNNAGEVDWRVAQARSLLGAALAGQQRHQQAETHLLEGFTRLESSVPAGNRKKFLSQAIERLVKLYDAWDKPNEAQEWRVRLEQLTAQAEAAQP
uniref:Serine/threonine protein kinase n=1 Tax=uncultured marine thaumarchaeote AD1000_01_F04 TaxID=1455879 RepID=A0A075FFV8_9ARCH|nr:serine/threonine protein kinase [uncultured marine thaumarchaeote AD1000_01_F04]